MHWVNFCKWYEVWGKFCVFFNGCQTMPVLFAEKTVLSSLNCLCTYVKNQLTRWVYFWTLFCPIDLCVCPFAKAYCLDYYMLFWNQVMWILQQSYQSYFSYSRSFLSFHLNVKISLFFSKGHAEILIMIMLNLYIKWEENWHLNNTEFSDP